MTNVQLKALFNDTLEMGDHEAMLWLEAMGNSLEDLEACIDEHSSAGNHELSDELIDKKIELEAMMAFMSSVLTLREG